MIAHNSIPGTAHLCLVTMKNLTSRECIFITRKMDPKCIFLRQQQLSVSSTTVFAGLHVQGKPSSAPFSSPFVMHILFIVYHHHQSHAAYYTLPQLCSPVLRKCGSQTWMGYFIRCCRKHTLRSWELLLHVAGSYPNCLINCNCLFNTFLRAGSCIQSLAQLIASV